MTLFQQRCRHLVSGMNASLERFCVCGLPWRYARVIVEDRRQRQLRDAEARRQESAQLIIAQSSDDTEVVDVDCLDKTEVMLGFPDPMLSVFSGTGILPRLPARVNKKKRVEHEQDEEEDRAEDQA